GTIARINIDAGGPFAPVAEPEASDAGGAESIDLGLDAVASSLAVAANGSSGASVAPRLTVEHTERTGDSHRPPVQSIQHAVEDNSPRGRAMREVLERIIDALVLDDELLDVLMIELDFR
ncbi:MAG: hypothetical protein WDZ48_01500, partial [Pirellulales bacterium]